MALVAVFAAVACSSGDEDDPTAAPAASAQGQLGGDAKSIAERRGLSDADIEAALKTFTPTGVMDEYLMFSSGGHSGQLHVIGMPSMRLLKTIAVFTPESWQGYGIGSNESEEVLEGGRVNGDEVLWGDTHHPALTETAGEYDGEFVFTNDKANARVAVISLKDFETKQIVKNPITLSDHGATMVTPNSEWVIEGGQYAMPLSGDYAPISDYQEKYRGMVTMWKFDRAAGRIDTTQSFAIELPPYWQDLCDAGKLVSEGWFVCGSFNTEMATGGNQDGNPPFEAGASQADMDYLHVFNIEKAIAARDAGKTVQIQGFPVIPLEVAASDGILHLVPEPKSPHGADVTPGGEYIVVSGKLDPHVTIYSFDKIIAAIAAGPAETDSFGVPVLAFDDVVEAQVEVGLGPLHTQFDNKGYAYTSLFLDSAVARWTLGGPYASLNPDPEWSLITKTQVHYNVGHIAAAEGDTVSPDGKYLVSLNKWSLDRFNLVGPLLPQNFQLLDIEGTGEEMPVIYDMPVGFGEPHYAQIIKADKIHAWEVYPEIGFNPLTGEIDPSATLAGEERVERDGNTVHVYMTAVRSHFTPEHVTVKEGDHVAWHITNIERGLDATHGFAMPGKNVSLSIEPGETITTEFDVTDDGVFPFYCTEFCSALHLEMAGYFLVEPSGS
ncbi:MAG: Sec-dependent nitrous-oxide reductase [Chloroflexi bacterium]|nr:Sec-dependent nitrous-oxide reductase [Chloroflexota bacterium]